MRKTFAALILLSSFSAFARTADYRCSLYQYNLEITIAGRSTHLWVSDSSDRSTLFQAVTTGVTPGEKNMIYDFYPANNGPVTLTLRTADVVSFPSTLSGKFEGTIAGMRMHDRFNCYLVE